MALFTTIATVCTKFSTGVVFCAVAANSNISGFDTQEQCDAYYNGRMSALIQERGTIAKFNGITCRTADEAKIILDSAPANFEKVGWKYKITQTVGN